MNRRVALTIYLLLILGPLLAGAIYSFMYSTGSIGLLSTGFTANAWKIVLSDGVVLKSFWSTIIIATMSIFLAVALALLVVVRCRWLHRSKLSGILLHIPLAVPPMIAAFLMFQLLYKGGIISRLFYQVGITKESSDFPELVNDRLNLGVVISMVIFVTPFFILFFLQKWESLGIRKYRILAGSLGAGRYVILRRVILPLLIKNSWLNITLYWLILFGNFEIPLILGRQNPPVVSVLISQKLTRYDLAEIPQAYAISLIYLMVVFTIFFIFVMNSRRTSAL